MKFLITAISIVYTFSACSRKPDRGPGLQFSLFMNTPNWEIAQAVEKEDKIAIEALISHGKIDLNLREPQYGQTLLSLAVGNEKLISAKLLLEHGAKLNIKNKFGFEPIHDASDAVNLNKKSYDMLELLLNNGANPNAEAFSKPEDTTSHSFVPLMGAVRNVKCAELLLARGANLYYRHNETYEVWVGLFNMEFDEEIFVARYLIIDKKMPVPEIMLYTIPNHQPQTALKLLNEFNARGDKEKEKAKAEILDYLKRIKYPQKQVYKPIK